MSRKSAGLYSPEKYL